MASTRSSTIGMPRENNKKEGMANSLKRSQRHSMALFYSTFVRLILFNNPHTECRLGITGRVGRVGRVRVTCGGSKANLACT